MFESYNNSTAATFFGNTEIEEEPMRLNLETCEELRWWWCW